MKYLLVQFLQISNIVNKSLTLFILWKYFNIFNIIIVRKTLFSRFWCKSLKLKLHFVPSSSKPVQLFWPMIDGFFVKVFEMPITDLLISQLLYLSNWTCCASVLQRRLNQRQIFFIKEGSRKSAKLPLKQQQILVPMVFYIEWQRKGSTLLDSQFKLLLILIMQQ